MSARTRILIVTDSPVLPSGMAEATRLLFSTLLDKYPERYELHQVALFHCYAVTTPRWPLYPTMAGKGPDGRLRFAPEDKYGQKTTPKCIARVRPDIVFGFGDLTPSLTANKHIGKVNRFFARKLLRNPVGRSSQSRGRLAR
jgi:hypothetical protein